MNLILAAVALAVVIAALKLRGAVRVTLLEAGKRALEKQPDRISLRRDDQSRWLDPAAVERIAAPLRALGFEDLGAYAIDPLPGARMRILLKRDDSTAAFVYEHAKVGAWLELSSRYADGTTSALSSRRASGLPHPPFFRIVHTGPGEPAALYERLRRERPVEGLLALTPETVLSEYEKAWARIIAWQKQHGLTPEQVAAAARSVRISKSA